MSARSPNTARRFLPEIALLIAIGILPLVFPMVGGTADMLNRMMNWGIIGLGFDLLFGYAGLLSFGQAAFYGAGGFVTAYLLTAHIISNVWLGLLIGTVFAGVFGLVIGFLSLRRIGIYFTMITLAFGEMAYFLENSPLSHWTGGENGLPGVPAPHIGSFVITGPWRLYGLMAGVFFIGFILARRIIHSPVGAVMHAIRENATRAEALGHRVGLYKLAVFVIAALYAGLAGGLLGIYQSYMPPDAFSLDTSGQLVVQTVIGGTGTLIGPLVGATLWLYLRTNLQAVPGIGGLWKFILGLIFVVLITVLRRGICGELRARWPRRGVSAAGVEAPEAEADVAPPVAAPALPMLAPRLEAEAGAPALEARGVVKRYGGLVAVNDVSIRVPEGALHAVIGPNGAGKSTFFKMLAGEVRPTAGEVRLFGRTISGLGATRVCQLGLSKSYQVNQLFPHLTVRENLRIAALARRRGPFRLDLIRGDDSIAEVETQIEGALAIIQLAARADDPVHVLAYGEKRRLEIGLALATGPNVLLLDEPLAGMSPAERVSTKALIHEIRRNRTLLIVEHDMDAVFELADRITVLYDGRFLAEGTPEEIQRNRAVQDAYLGGMHENEPVGA